MATWSFLTNHARAMLFISAHPDTRVRDLAAVLDVTERTAFTILADLTAEGYLLKVRVGRRNHYTVQHHLPLRDAANLPLGDSHGRERTLGDLLNVLVDTGASQPSP
ncbi:MAG: helix-turn-helix domain-containing protein [Acidimicrobiales bacterium]